MKVKERISSIVLLCVFGFAFWYSGSFPEVPQIMPRLISGMGCILCAALLIKTFIFQYSDGEKQPPKLEKRTAILLSASIAALVIYVLLIKVVGYYVTTFFFINILAFVIDSSRRKWQYPVVALGIMLIIYLIFDWFLSIPLPKGILF